MSEIWGTESLSDDAILTVLVVNSKIALVFVQAFDWVKEWLYCALIGSDWRTPVRDWVPDHQNGRHISMKVYCKKSSTEWMFDIIRVHLSAKRCEHASADYFKWFGWRLMLVYNIISELIKGCTEHWWFVFVDLRYQTILKRIVGKLKFTLDFFLPVLRFYIQWKGRGTFPLRHRIEHTSIYPPHSVRAKTKD